MNELGLMLISLGIGVIIGYFISPDYTKGYEDGVATKLHGVDDE